MPSKTSALSFRRRLGDHRAVIIGVYNMKGGVAKTTTTYTLAEALASRGLRVLMVDSDVQQNLTSAALDFRLTRQGLSDEAFREMLETSVKRGDLRRLMYFEKMGVGRASASEIDWDRTRTNYADALGDIAGPAGDVLNPPYTVEIAKYPNGGELRLLMGDDNLVVQEEERPFPLVLLETCMDTEKARSVFPEHRTKCSPKRHGFGISMS